MTLINSPQLISAAQAARLLGVTRQRVLGLAASAVGFPAAVPTSTGGRVWSRAALQAWAAVNPDPDPVFTGPGVAPVGDPLGDPPKVRKLLALATNEALLLNHPWIGEAHLGLAMLHPDCPGAARAVL